jgi:Na+-transporting methylmalonyl-CoA/oxaloacetate decarboxylase gamma subunit
MIYHILIIAIYIVGYFILRRIAPERTMDEFQQDANVDEVKRILKQKNKKHVSKKQ